MRGYFPSLWEVSQLPISFIIGYKLLVIGYKLLVISYKSNYLFMEIDNTIIYLVGNNTMCLIDFSL